MRLALLATTALLLTLLACESVLACNSLPVSPVESYKNADVVFKRELVHSKRLPSSSSVSFSYTFAVNRSLKGPDGTVVSIFGAGSEGDASYEPGFLYPVYAKEADDTLTGETCAGNSIIGAANEMAGVFVSRTFSYSPPLYWQRWLMSGLQICGLGVLLGSGVFVWRRYFMKST